MGSPMRPSLADLPDSVVEDILVRLPLREAVRTSVLSRAWRHRWQSIPELLLEDRQIPAAAIDTVLLLHSAPVRRFSLATSHTAHADRWIRSLSRRGAGHLLSLDLSFDHQGPFYPIDSSVFSFRETLTHLSLAHCSLSLPPHPLASFPALRSLRLQDVEFPDDRQLSVLISGRPALFHRLTSLRMTVSLGDLCQISVMLCLMRSAPNLQQLFLMGLDYDEPSYDAGATGPGVDFWIANQSLELFASLRTVELKGIMIQGPEMEFLRFILARAQVLETLTIISPTEITMLHKSSLKILWEFPRTSTRAQIIFT